MSMHSDTRDYTKSWAMEAIKNNPEGLLFIGGRLCTSDARRRLATTHRHPAHTLQAR